MKTLRILQIIILSGLILGGGFVSGCGGPDTEIRQQQITNKIAKIWDQFLAKKPDGQLFIAKETDQLEKEMDAYLKRLKRRTSKSL